MYGRRNSKKIGEERTKKMNEKRVENMVAQLGWKIVSGYFFRENHTSNGIIEH